jgi:hypothetical protein
MIAQVLLLASLASAGQADPNGMPGIDRGALIKVEPDRQVSCEFWNSPGCSDINKVCIYEYPKGSTWKVFESNKSGTTGKIDLPQNVGDKPTYYLVVPYACDPLKPPSPWQFCAMRVISEKDNYVYIATADVNNQMRYTSGTMQFITRPIEAEKKQKEGVHHHED